MSAALLRRGLELLASDSAANNQSGLKKKQGGKNQKAVLSSHKTGMKKQLRKLKQQGVPQNQRASAKNRVIKSAVEEYKKRQSQDHLAQNLKYIRLSAKNMVAEGVCKRILSHHSGRKSKDQQKTKKKKVQQKSVFTDQDFQKFQREYFGKS
ncbi:hypothetical protein GDO81_018130 [Engystomops pustulosus]|uniref:Active regulator of SIRT1 n=1 Tax=Engystomops pustulosus TaxID=76066 RepID=A0AAV7A9M1_ENGPU|nr:hypothetical protein GDO81_018130 [Engystomops pustulosus]KAG8556604.1 hypothetical protein GDO81_018130 [Engystomops pustulosus]